MGLSQESYTTFLVIINNITTKTIEMNDIAF